MRYNFVIGLVGLYVCWVDLVFFFFVVCSLCYCRRRRWVAGCCASSLSRFSFYLANLLFLFLCLSSGIRFYLRSSKCSMR